MGQVKVGGGGSHSGPTESLHVRDAHTASGRKRNTGESPATQDLPKDVCEERWGPLGLTRPKRKSQGP